ncbi:MAG TPA: hypothetical protein VGH33_07925 [Isosphaeraceae bacterium]
MKIEFGNASELDTRGTGWFVGFGTWTKDGQLDLRHVPEAARSRGLCLKWMDHRAGDPRGVGKPPSEGRTLSILASDSGRFRLEFSDDPNFLEGRTVCHTLARPGDFVAWGKGLHHSWFVDDDCTVVTLRWIPEPS